MTTVALVRSWCPTELESAGDRLASACRVLDATVGDLTTSIRVADDAWEGDAALAALARLREHARAGQALVETITVVRRAVHAAADALTAARTLLDRAQCVADDNRLLITNEGRVLLHPLHTDPALPGQPSRQTLVARSEVQAMVTEALRAAEEADVEAGFAVRAAHRLAADGQIGEPDDRAVIAMIGTRGLPALGTGPTQVAAWWATLSAAARRRWIVHRPQHIGMLDGVPAEARDRANRRVLRTELADARAALEDFRARHSMPNGNLADHARYDDLLARLAMLESVENGLDGPDRHLLLLDPQPPGRVAITIGDIDTADHVAVLVPGFGSGVTNYVPTITGNADRLVHAAVGRLEGIGDPGSVAAVAWIGYHAPLGADVAFYGDAERGATSLRSTLWGIDASRTAAGGSVHLTTLGHSYGSVVAGLASQAGTPMDDLVLFGSPGSGVQSAASLDVGPGHVYAGAARDDPVCALNWFGPDPTSPRFGGQVFGVDGGSVPGMPGATFAPSSGHSEYYGRGTESLANMVSVVIGRPENVSLVPATER